MKTNRNIVLFFYFFLILTLYLFLMKVHYNASQEEKTIQYLLKYCLCNITYTHVHTQVQNRSDYLTH